MSGSVKQLAKIVLRAEICASWGFAGKANRVNNFVNYLKSTSKWDVKCTVTPKTGGLGEFYLFQLKDEKEIPIYSNNASLHPAAISGRLDNNIFEDLESNLMKVRSTRNEFTWT